MKKIFILLIILIAITIINHNTLLKQNNNIIKNQIKIEKFFEKIQIQNQIQIKEKEEKTLHNARITAYSPTDNKSGICADKNPNITATGKKPEIGICAVNPAKIPYGSLLYIPGYGYAVAEDTGAAMRNYNGIAIDVVMETYKDAINWGVRYLDVQIITSSI